MDRKLTQRATPFPEDTQRVEEAEKMNALLSAIVTWLSINFGLPAAYDHPEIVFAPVAQISDLGYAGGSKQYRRAVVAVYNDVERVIYLPDSWDDTSPADLSILVHEMVHHLQNLSEIEYACPGAREEPAYAAQGRWLKLFGHSILDEFDLDRMTLKVTVVCYWP